MYGTTRSCQTTSHAWAGTAPKQPPRNKRRKLRQLLPHPLRMLPKRQHLAQNWRRRQTPAVGSAALPLCLVDGIEAKDTYLHGRMNREQSKRCLQKQEKITRAYRNSSMGQCKMRDLCRSCRSLVDIPYAWQINRELMSIDKVPIVASGRADAPRADASRAK